MYHCEKVIYCFVTQFFQEPMWKTVVTSMQDYEDEMIPVCQAPEADLTRDASPSVPALLTLWGPDPRRWEVASDSSIAFIVLSRKHPFTSPYPSRLKRNHTFFSTIFASTQCNA